MSVEPDQHHFGTAPQYGQSAAPSGTFKKVYAEWSYTCGIRSDDTLSCWGRMPNNYGNGPALEIPGKIQQIATQSCGYCALSGAGEVSCTGKCSSSDKMKLPGKYVMIAYDRDSLCGVLPGKKRAACAIFNQGVARPTPVLGVEIKQIMVRSSRVCLLVGDGVPMCYVTDTSDNAIRLQLRPAPSTALLGQPYKIAN